MTKLVARKINSTVGKTFIRENHYSRGSHNGPTCYGLFDGETLVGVCAFATPNSENVRGSVFGMEHVSRVTELHRLVLFDEIPKNSESFFIAASLRLLKADKPHLWAVVSFADSTQGHVGTIYQATNALYYGRSAAATFYEDETGRLRHPRQNGHNVTVAEARDRGWSPVKRQAKHRYLFLLPDNRTHRKALREMVLLPIEADYPKASVA